MPSVKDKKLLLNRVRRLIGQLEGVQRALEEDRECADVLHAIAACRGALNGLLVEVVAEQVRGRVARGRNRNTAADELLVALRSYLS